MGSLLCDGRQEEDLLRLRRAKLGGDPQSGHAQPAARRQGHGGAGPRSLLLSMTGDETEVVVMQARFEVRSWPVRLVLIAVVLTAALLMGLAAVNYAIQASGSGVLAGMGSCKVQAKVLV